jgi:hypothetical protein
VVKTKGVGGGEQRTRGLMLSYFIIARFLEGHLQNGKEMVRTGQDQAAPLFCPNWKDAL